MFCLCLAGCDPKRIYENNIDLQKNEWKQEQELVFDFAIEDPDKTYNLLYNVRYAHTYPFYNLYISYFLYDSTGRQIPHKNPVGMDLFNPKTGKPLGSGLGDFFDYSILDNKPIRFPMKGKYTMKIKQYMRQNPLIGIASFGIRIESNDSK